MPATDKYNEIAIAASAVIFIFFVITTMVILILLFYQKKKFQHKRQILSLEKEFSEALLKSQIEIQEQYFNHVSSELHDNVGQILSLARVQINIINENDQLDREILQDVKLNIAHAMDDLRHIARGLSNETLKDSTIQAAVATEVERINKSGIFLATIGVHGGEIKVAERQKLILFRMIQESLQNIIKHANASEVNINFSYLPANLQTTIKDNGCGFDIATALQKRSGLGLVNIRNRAALAGGVTHIQSKPGTGTIITIDLPYA